MLTANTNPAMKWISVETEGWAGTFIVIRSSEVEGTWRTFGCSKKEAERKYRSKYGLEGVRMRRRFTSKNAKF